MADSLIDPGTSPRPTSGNQSFFQANRLVLGIIGVVLVALVIFALVGYFGLGLFKSVGTSTQSVTTSPGVTSSQTATASPAAVNPPEAALSNSFTFRNVFAPTVKPVVKAAASTGTSTSSATAGTATTSNTLYLMSTQLTPTKLATFRWNGQSYTVGEGGQVGTSPWQVVTISSGSVLMLFGDAQVTVTTGQSISK